MNSMAMVMGNARAAYMDLGMTWIVMITRWYVTDEELRIVLCKYIGNEGLVLFLSDAIVYT